MTIAAEKDLLISDSQSERRWTFALSVPGSFERAKREDGANLLKGIAFYVITKIAEVRFYPI